jgi:hypothetical protein
MKQTIGLLIAGAILCASSFAFAQIDKEPPKLPEVSPGIDNPNNPAVPGNDETGVRSDRAPAAQLDSRTAEGRARCSTLTDTLARRRCLEDLQRIQIK